MGDTILHLDARFSRQHVLSNITTLSQLCQRTSLPQTPKLQDKLLQWVIQGLAVQQLRGNLDAGASREMLVEKTMPILLLQRRVVVYLSSKFRFMDEEGVVYQSGKSPESALGGVFTNYCEFHSSFPRGRPLESKFVSIKEDITRSRSSTNPPCGWASFRPCCRT